MKIGITVEKVMQKNFPIVDSKERITNCVSIMGKDNACLVIKNGNFNGIISRNEILDDFLHGIEHVSEGVIREDIGIINANSDIFDLISLMKNEHIDFVVVKKDSNIIGIISKKDLRNLKFYPKLEENLEKLNQVTIR